jgi:tetratricopeptide (TPR) repeat protein
MKNRSQRTITIFAALLLSFFAASSLAQTPERGIGPLTLVAKHGTFSVRLLRRDKTTLWLLQRTQSGTQIETGVPMQDIVRFDIPRAAAFAAAEQAATAEQVAQAYVALKRISDLLKPYRDLPGMPVDDALVMQGRMLEKQGRPTEALALYDDILKQPYAPSCAVEAHVRAAVCRVGLGQPEAALAHLDEARPSEDRLDLLSDYYFTRGQALAALGRHEDAVMSFMQLVVFHPFVQNNEPRGLEAAVPSFIAMKDWDGAYRARESLRASYPAAPEMARVDELLAPFAKEMDQEKMFDGNAKAE